MWFSVFSFLNGDYAQPLTLNSRETSVCSTCHHYIWSIKVLITGMWKFIGFDGFGLGFRFGSNFFWRFWIIFSMILRFLIDPDAPLHLWLFVIKVGWLMALFSFTFFIVKSTATLTKHPGLLKSGFFDKSNKWPSFRTKLQYSYRLEIAPFKFCDKIIISSKVLLFNPCFYNLQR